MANIADWLIQKNITVYHSTPTVFRSWAQMLGDQQKFPQVRCIRTGAEQTGTEDVELFRKYFPRECVLHVGFSSTEAYHVTRFFIGYESDIAGSIPLGYPPDGTEVMILDEDGKQVGVNRVGEIAVKSRYVSVGYWRKPDLTNSVFLPDPEGGEERIYLTGDLGRIAADGCLKFLGRKDFQVKIRGYSVNVAEIEQAMRGIHRVKDVAVVPQASSSSGHQLAAYVVPTAHPAPTIRQMRESLSRIFPDYKIPSYYVFLDSLPLLPGGKVDRRALPELGSGRPELEVPFVAPRTPSEESLAEIWKEVLGLDQVGIHDNFLELGGDSLLAGQVISRVIKTFRVELPLRLLFEAPTVADMAVVIVQHQAKKAEQEDIERLLAELEGISGEEAQRLLGDENESSSLSDV